MPIRRPRLLPRLRAGRAMLIALAALCLLAAAQPLRAHEVRPAIGDLSIEGREIRLALQLNVEALLAGIDLDGLRDTDEADQAAAYDRLRALAPDALAAALREAWPLMRAPIALSAGDAAVPLRLGAVEIAVAGDAAQPRDSRVVLSGELPPGAGSVTLHWPDGYGDLVLRQQGVEDGYTGYLSGGQASEPIALAGGGAMSAWGAFLSYLPVGFDHILPLGLDHILFVLGLFFLAPRAGPLLWQVTAFTAAHTVTLALGALGIVSVPGSIVEPIIAASIVYVAVENLLTDGLSPWRPFVVFLFGLLHGLGFASVLGEFGLPEAQFVPALLGFNVGVELGQLTVIAAALAIVWAALRASDVAGMERGVVAGYLAAALALALLAAAGPDAALRLAPAAARDWLAPLWVFVIPIMALCFLCAVTVAASSVGLRAYRDYVAIPASVVIAAVGAFWFVERVFL